MIVPLGLVTGLLLSGATEKTAHHTEISAPQIGYIRNAAETTYELIAKGQCKYKDGSQIVLECSADVAISVEVTKKALTTRLEAMAKVHDGQIVGTIQFTLRKKGD